MPPSKKRKLDYADITQAAWDEVKAAAENAALAGISSKPQRQAKKNDANGESEEKRLRVFRKKAPQTYLERLDRVRSQRMFLIDRERKMSSDRKHEEEVFDIAGSTGNVYQVTIAKQPKCSCPDNSKGNQCKHIIYVLVNILKAPEHLAYQLAFVSAELTEIFSNAPDTPQTGTDSSPSTTSSTQGHRKPIEGDCPVCVMEFEAGDDIVWCAAACGNNIHRQCFEQWAASKLGQVKCVYCRTPWKGNEESVKRISKMGQKNEDGYVNVAMELGLSGERDMSSYHQPWVNRQYGDDYDGYGGGYGGYQRRGGGYGGGSRRGGYRH